MTSNAEILKRADGAALTYDRIVGTRSGAPGVVFLHGLMSDRTGTKAQVLADHCRRQDLSFVRFDMFGHGASSGRFEDGTISRWTEDTIAILDDLTTGPQILIGSSMGGWVMLRAALARADRIKGLIGIAAAPDFTEGIRAGFSPAQQTLLQSKGIVEVASDHDSRPYPISRRLIDDGRENAVLAGAIAINCPVRLVHGQRDASVPWKTSRRLAEKITSDDVSVLLIKDGDHRLSRPQDLRRLCGVLDDLLMQLSSASVSA